MPVCALRSALGACGRRSGDRARQRGLQIIPRLRQAVPTLAVNKRGAGDQRQEQYAGDPGRHYRPQKSGPDEERIHLRGQP